MAIFTPARRGSVTLFMKATPALKGAPAKVVYDGDGLSGVLTGNQPMRFLGCDTPEVAYTVPTGPSASRPRQKIGDALWGAYLDAPLAPGAWPEFKQKLHPLVEQRFLAVSGPGSAANHAHHAGKARQALIDLIEGDRAALGIAEADFRLFVAVTHEVFDGYGRLLAFVNTDVRDAALRPTRTYNERMVANGMASPFFIWPNVDPFIGRPAVTDAALPPRELRKAAGRSRLGRSRQDAAAARAAGLGIYDPANPLRLLAYELRMLGDRKAPSRWVIDLSAEDGDPTLYPPDGYVLISNPEDRLFVPAEYVPLFAQRGWQPARLVRF